MAKGTIVAKNVVKSRSKNDFFFVDGDGNVRKVKRQIGSKKGRRTCLKPGETKKTTKKRTRRRPLSGAKKRKR